MISKARERIIRRLRTRRGRPREGLVLVEGVRAALEALAGGADGGFAVVTPGLETSDREGRVIRALEARGVDLVEVEDEMLEELSDTESPQGVLLVCREPEVSLDRIREGGGTGILLLDRVQDPGNLGTLVRAARAFGLRGVVALDGTVDPWNPKAVRASAGALFHVPVVKEGWDLVERWIRTEAMGLLVADPAGVDVASVEPEEPWLLAVGNEGSGARAGVVEAAERMVSVPMAGGGDSLNVGMAGTVLLYALSRKGGA